MPVGLGIDDYNLNQFFLLTSQWSHCQLQILQLNTGVGKGSPILLRSQIQEGGSGRNTSTQTQIWKHWETLSGSLGATWRGSRCFTVSLSPQIRTWRIASC